ncbi:MAG: enoyl-CoA hydratase/isomerase family protein [Deltaproteobacteria bacterium]|nr:enoyl-CoA hydratase/isomerase family protein [Deltaproteobacteria bacterium]
MITITLDAPNKNALSTAHMRSILEQLDRANGAPVMFIGASHTFCAGLDLNEVASRQGDDMFAFLELLERCMTSIYLYPGPTVACVNGHAIAGGCVLALCCDHRVAVDVPEVRIGLNEVALGVRFPPRVLAIVRRRVIALDRVVLGAGLSDPHTARRLGLVDEIVPDVEAAARARLTTLGRHPAEAYAITKRDLRGTADDLCPESEHAGRLRAMVPQWTAPVVRERVAAVLRKR